MFGERQKPPSVEEAAQADSMRAASRSDVAAVTALAQLGDDVVASSYSLTSASTSASSTARMCVGELAHAIAVDRDAQARLRLHLVALGDGDLAHVVAEAGDPQVPRLVRSRARRARPDADASLDTGVLPVADDDLARLAAAASRCSRTRGRRGPTG